MRPRVWKGWGARGGRTECGMPARSRAAASSRDMALLFDKQAVPIHGRRFRSAKERQTAARPHAAGMVRRLVAQGRSERERCELPFPLLLPPLAPPLPRLPDAPTRARARARAPTS